MNPTDRAEELNILVRARYPILYILSWEERRIEKILGVVAEERRKKLYGWSITDGLTRLDGYDVTPFDSSTRSPIRALEAIAASTESAIFVLKDFHPFLDDQQPVSDHPIIVRKLRDLASQLKNSRKTLVILSPLLQAPAELEKDFTVLDYALPTEEELRESLARVLRSANEISGKKVKLDDETREKVLHAAQGLTCTEAENVFAKSLVMAGELNIDVIIAEKKQIIRRSQLLEYFPAEEDLSKVGGMSLLKEWLAKRSLAFSERARKFGLPEPKGLLLLGVQGAGKSLVAKAVASEWKLPLLRLDLGRMFSQFVGSSEQNMRTVLTLAESIAPCVSGDTRIVLGDGSEKTIEAIYCDEEIEKLAVLGMNKKYELESVCVRAVTRRPSPGLFRVQLQHNYLCTTSNHLHPTMKNGEIEWTRTDNLRVGDYIAIPRQIPTEKEPPPIIQFLPTETRLYHEKAFDFATTESISPQRRFAARTRNANFVKIKELSNLKVYPDFKNIIKFVFGRGGTSDSTLNKLPEILNEKIGYVLGLIASDGYLGKNRIGFINTELVLHEEFANIMRTQFCHAVSRRLMAAPKNATLPGTGADSKFKPCFVSYLDNLLLNRILKNIQKQLLRLPQNFIQAWVRGFFDGDGSIASEKVLTPKITLTSKVKVVNQLVRSALHRVGFPTTNSDSPNIEITSFEDVFRFINEIGSSHPKKRERMNQWLLKEISEPKNRTDSIPVGYLLRTVRGNIGMRTHYFKDTGPALMSYYERNIVQPSRTRLCSIVQEMRDWVTQNGLSGGHLNKLESLIDSPIGWSKVIAIEAEEPTDYVYDLVCEPHHTFIANGIVTHNCVLWLDELEKGLAGVASSHLSDAGTAARVFGSFLTWMQEKTAPVFVVATANDISILPPEALRKGRFDEIFFIDLPTLEERREIFAIHFAKRGRDALQFDLNRLALESGGFSGAEIEQAIISALYDAFEAGRELCNEDLLRNLTTSIPLSQTMENHISALRSWATTHARPASRPEVTYTLPDLGLRRMEL
jgi:SpoVK/Ycf46/Vps4 family AAA+-type ATPase/intein/homing endonuclease